MYPLAFPMWMCLSTSVSMRILWAVDMENRMSSWEHRCFFFFSPSRARPRQTHPQIQIQAHSSSQVNIQMWMRLIMKKVLLSTWPCATRAGATSMWMHMAGSPFNWPFHTSCSVCVPNETSKPCLNVETTRVGGVA